jgi:hypothetical protein
MPADVSISDGDAEVPFLDPYYGVMIVASELAFNDITYEDKANDLAGKAQFLYQQMVRKNRKNTYGTRRPIPTSSYRIRSTEFK